MIDEDPGWGRALRSAIPMYGQIAAKRRSGAPSDGLILMRQLFVSFCSAVVLFGIVLLFVDGTADSGDPAVGRALILVLVGAASMTLGPRFERPLDGTSDAHAVVSYRNRFFVRIATSEVAALLGFAGAFTTRVWWVYPAGAFVTMVGFTRAAPTASNLRRDQEQLFASGSPVNLVRALRGTGAS